MVESSSGQGRTMKVETYNFDPELPYFTRELCDECWQLPNPHHHYDRKLWVVWQSLGVANGVSFDEAKERLRRIILAHRNQHREYPSEAERGGKILTSGPAFLGAITAALGEPLGRDKATV
jgi:hypothetical protein